jgi:hypothetical protein
MVDEVPEPVGAEFKLVYDRQIPVCPWRTRLMSERVPVLDARFFVTAVLTQRETGGNLSEVLDNLASVIRDRLGEAPGAGRDRARSHHRWIRGTAALACRCSASSLRSYADAQRSLGIKMLVVAGGCRSPAR